MSLNFSKHCSLTPRPKPVLRMKLPAEQVDFTCPFKSKKQFLEDARGEAPMSIAVQRRALPIYKVKSRLMSEIEKHSTLILIGETGSGKTTQIPQYLHENNLEGEGMIGVTQPRRVAAITIATRVALEMNTSVGQSVGYCVRFEDATSPYTKIKYLTDGMLMQEAMTDDCLLSYNVIILDEAHERTVRLDVLFGIIKDAQKRRVLQKHRALKVIIMSATMDVDHFSKYFNNAPTLYLEGRQYPVQIFNAVESHEDYNFTSLVTVFQIHKEAPPNHDILVFLTGQEEIEAMAANIRSIAKDPQCSGPGVKVYPLYAALAANKQLEVFQSAPQNIRKIILSTNIAETSITISGIKYVVDSGKVKIRINHPGTGLDMLKVENISQAQAWQRTGRAGRECEGFCYRTYTETEFEEMDKTTKPEIQRCNLSVIILQLLALGIDTLTFDFMDKPPKEAILDGLEQLKHLGAVDNVDNAQITPLGKQMVLFPLDPKFSKIILSAHRFGCVEEVLSVIAILSGESIFINNLSKREEAASARAKFTSMSGDHITLLNIFRAYNNTCNKHVWCFENFLNNRNLDYAVKVKKQLGEICRRCNIPMSSCGEDTEKLCKCLITGLFMNIAELQRDKKYMTVTSRQLVHIHPSSVLHGTLPPLLLFTELVQTGRCFMRYLTPLQPEWVLDLVATGFTLDPQLPHNG